MAYYSSAQRRRDRLEQELNLPPLTIEGWKKNHLCFISNSIKGKSKQRKEVTYKTAVQEAIQKTDTHVKRRIGIVVNGEVVYVTCFAVHSQWFDEETGARMGRIEISLPFLGRTIVTRELA